jgi:ubiquinone/menaquinone biosynthesis C-methylase UbiE
VAVSAQEGFRLWSESYDFDLNPLLALERRILAPRLPPLRERCIVDIATGTGYWLYYARSCGARAFGLDLSAEMLARASEKPGLRGYLVRADMSSLPFHDSFADVAICSLALGYVRPIEKLFREMARVARTVIVSDLHEDAVQAGWRRSFQAEGRHYEIEQFPHPPEEVDKAAKNSGLAEKWRVAAHFGEPERDIFVREGRVWAFAGAARIPAIRCACWTRS